MHMLIIQENGTKCSCGWAKPTMTGGDAQRAAYIHARANMPAMVTDYRLCSDNCRDTRANYLCPDNWHHKNCENRIQ